MATKKNFSTEAILKEVYPLVEKGLNSGYLEWKHLMSEFIQYRSQSLFDIAPCDRIYYVDSDKEKLLRVLGLTDKEIKAGISHTYYWNKNPFKPQSAKDTVTIIALCIVRYFLLKMGSDNKEKIKLNTNEKFSKDLELAMIYQAFSAKYYPSIHYGFFKVVPPSKYRHIMEYVVNHKLSLKFDLKSQGSVIGAIKVTNNTWVDSYKKEIKDFDDEDVTYVIQQLHTRIKSFMKNIAALYYETYKDKDFITYDKDILPEEGGSGVYNLTTNDSFKLQMYVENTMTKINTSQVSYQLCKQSSDANVKTEEIKTIIEAILNNSKNLEKIKEYITLNIAVYLFESEVKEVNNIRFLAFCIKRKPNTKDPNLIRIKDLEEELLDDTSIGYRKRKHREATKQSYHKALATYFALLIIMANK